MLKECLAKKANVYLKDINYQIVWQGFKNVRQSSAGMPDTCTLSSRPEIYFVITKIGLHDWLWLVQS